MGAKRDASVRGGLRAVAVVLLVATQGVTAEGITTIRLQEKVADWILDEQSGRIFASLKAEGAVVEYDPVSGKEVRRFPVGKKALQLLIKGQRLVVAGSSGVALHVIDLKENKVEGRVALGGYGIHTTFCSRVDNPYVYALCTMSSDDWDGEIIQVDVVKRQVRKRASTEEWSSFYEADIVASADGRYICLDEGLTSDGATLMAFDEEKLTLQYRMSYHQYFGQVMAGPSNRFWTLGNLLFPIDLKPRQSSARPRDLAFEFTGVRKFSGSPVLIHPRLDMVVAVKDSKSNPTLIFETFSGPTPLQTVQLGKKKENKDGNFLGGILRERLPPQEDYDDAFGEGPLDRPSLQFDLKRNRVFYADGNAAHVVDLAALNLETEPLVLIEGPPKVSAEVDRAMVVPIKLTNPELQAKARFEVLAGPKGVRFDEKNQLVWNPTTANVGIHEVRVQATVGKSSDKLSIDVEVGRSAVVLPGLADQMAVDRQGRHAVLTVVSGAGLQDGRFGRPGPNNLVLVDLEKRTLIAQRALTKPIRSLRITDKAAYIVTYESAVVHSLKLDDLASDQRAFFNYDVREMEPLPGGRLAVQTERDLEVYDEKTMKKVDFPGLGNDESRPPYSGPMEFMDPDEPDSLVTSLGDGVRFAGLVLDGKTGAPRLLLKCPGILPVDRKDAEHAWRRGVWTDWGPLPWGRRVNGYQLQNRSNRAIADWEPAPTVLLQSYPVAVTARFAGDLHHDRREYSVRLLLEFRDLAEGALQEPMVLQQTQISQETLQQSRDDLHFPLLQAVADTIVVASFDRLFVVPAPAEQFKGFPEPLRFVAKQEPHEAKVGEKTTVKLQAVGGKGKKAYDLVSEIPGTSIDVDTGQIEVDTTSVWEFGKQNLERSLQGRELSDEGLAEKSQQAYRDLFGKPTDAFPMSARLAVAVTDEEGESDRLAAQLVVLGPREEIDELLAAADDESHPSMDELEDEFGDAPQYPPGPVRPESPGSDRELVRQLARAFETGNRVNEQIGEMNRSLTEMSRETASLKFQLAKIQQAGDRPDEVAPQLAEFQTQINALEKTSERQQGYWTTLLISLVVLVGLLGGMFVLMLKLLKRST